MDTLPNEGPEQAALAHRIDAALPQVQCTRCGYPSCGSYAAAVAAGEAINRCPPGGVAGIAGLAQITGRMPVPLDPACGSEGPLCIARVDASTCIGCARCREVCPVDAITGVPKRLHTVLAAWCTGCARCLSPCPVDCIALVPAGREWSPTNAEAARARFLARAARCTVPAGAAPTADCPPGGERAKRQAAVAAALARARARRASPAAKRQLRWMPAGVVAAPTAMSPMTTGDEP